MDGIEIVEIVENSFNIDIKEISYWDNNTNTFVTVKTVEEENGKSSRIFNDAD